MNLLPCKNKKQFFFFSFLFFNSFLSWSQNSAFSENFANLVTEDSRPGWIKINSNQQLNATDFIGNLNEGLGFSEEFDFALQKSDKDKYGNIHRLYQLTYQGVPVEHHSWLLHEKNRNVFLAQGHEVPILAKVPATPSVQEGVALGIILNEPDTSFTVKKYAWQDNNMERDIKLVRGNANATHFPKGDLVWVRNEKANLYQLAYAFDVFTIEPLSKKRYYVNAHNEQIIKQIDLIATNCFAEEGAEHEHQHTTTKTGTATPKNSFSDSQASGHANYVMTNGGIVDFTADNNGTDYTLKASNLGPSNNQVVHTLSANNNYDFDNLTEIRDADNDWQDDSIAIGAHWGTEKVYDYFLTKHNRKSFDGNGAPLISYVHYGENYVNAFWNGVNMTYGDGNGTSWGALTSFDVIAHEITHGVTENNGLNGLIYYSESGALNESFSDIFGIVFEFDYHPDGGDWLMGEDFDLANHEGFRSMSNPQDKGDPKTYYGTNWYTGYGDNAGVHTNSGAQNFWFYLLANGGSGTNEYQYTYNITGIGMEKAAAITYRNLTTYMNPNAEFIDARDGAIQSAIDLYGDGSTEHLATQEAWCAVGVGTTCLPEITVLTPTLNDILTAGTDYAITWSSTMTEVIATVKLEYTTDAGEYANWILIEDNVPNNGTYNWSIPSIYGTFVRVRVSDRGNSATPRPGHPLIADESRIFNVLPCIGANSFTLPASTNINVPATFTGNIPGDNFEWLVNDVVVGNTQHLTYTFTSFGTFSVTYRVEDTSDGCINIETLDVSVYPDAVCDAQVVSLNTAYQGGFQGATTEVSEPRPPAGDCENSWCSDYLVHSLWYTFVAPESGIVSIETNGIGYSSHKIALYEGINCTNNNPFQDAVLLAANQYKPNRCCNGSLIEKVCLVPGQTYHVQVGATYETDDFELTVTEKPIYNSIYETFSDCYTTPTDWTFRSNGKGIGVYNDSDNYDCIGCGIRVYGGGDVGEASVELPYVDFTNFTNAVLIFDYGFIAQVDGEENELRVEVATGCGIYDTIYIRNGLDLLTNNPPAHSDGDFRVPTCEEINRVEVDLSAYDGAPEVSIRLVAEGQWNNPIAIDNILVDMPNDTCRMLDSLVLVDIYHATNGSGWTNAWDLSEPLDSFYGVTLSPFGCVTAIDLDGSTDCFNCSDGGNNLEGTLPATIGELLQLEHLNLSRNDGLSGSTLTNIVDLTKLKQLNLYNINLAGSLPTEIGNLNNLTYLNLGYNQLSGELPSTFGDLSNLTYLRLNNNQFSGAIPASLNNLVVLYYLNLGNNNFSSLPDLGNLTQLESLYGYNNDFSGNLPTWLGNLVNLSILSLYNNQFTGEIPNSFADLDNVYNLDLSNNQLTGTLDPLCGMDQLYYVYLYNNQLEGAIPTCLASHGNLQALTIFNNNLSGIVPNFTNPDFYYLSIEDNRFTFSSILPNIDAIEAQMANMEYANYYYYYQQKVGKATSFLLTPGNDYTFDLGIDTAVTDNNYKWLKDGNYLQDVVGNNKLTITNASTNDLGRYSCEVTNNGASELTLYSFNYTLLEMLTPNDSVCNAIAINIDQSYTGTFVGASTEANEPSVTGGDCESSWCNSNLNGSVWYSFVAPNNPFISIETDSANTKIALYEGVNCGTANPFENAQLIAANDHKPNNCCEGSLIKLACLNAGTTYYIQVEQHDANEPDFDLIINNLASCSIPCDLVVTYNNVGQESCPNSGDGYIEVQVASANGHSIRYELYNSADELIRGQMYPYFGNLSAGTYTVKAISQDDATCTLDTMVTIEEKIDEIAPIPVCLSDTVNVALVHPTSGLPWGADYLYLTEMNTVFGNNKWHQLQFETVNPNLLFSKNYNTVYLEGSGVNTSILGTFLTTNRQLIEDWVAAGNTLFINVSPDNGGDINLGFNGVTLNNYYYRDSAFVVSPTHPIFIGPNTPTATAFRGYNFAHAVFSKGTLTATTLMESKNQEVLLMEADWNNGKVIFGAINPVFWINQETEIGNVRLNLLEYLKTNATPAISSTIQLTLDDAGTASIQTSQFVLGISDDCSPTSLTLSETTFDCADIGVKNIVVTATDTYNNTSTCAITVEIIDPDGNCNSNVDCPAAEILNENDMASNTYRAGVIESAGSIYANNDVTFMAREQITLKPGFHVHPNADFTAMIADCQTTTLEAPNTMATARTTPTIEQVSSNDVTVRPNPFRASTIIDFQLASEQTVHLAIYSMEGQLLRNLQEGTLSAGHYSKAFHANDLQGGMYLVVLQTEKEILTKKIILLE